jgi:hypothetical protein
MNTTQQPVSLRDWNIEQPIVYLWVAGVGYPGGKDFRHNTDTEDDEEYCDFAELDLLTVCGDLTGTVDEYGTWCWDGVGTICDERGNTIYNVKARRN